MPFGMRPVQLFPDRALSGRGSCFQTSSATRMTLPPMTARTVPFAVLAPTQFLGEFEDLIWRGAGDVRVAVLRLRPVLRVALEDTFHGPDAVFTAFEGIVEADADMLGPEEIDVVVDMLCHRRRRDVVVAEKDADSDNARHAARCRAGLRLVIADVALVTPQCPGVGMREDARSR